MRRSLAICALVAAICAPAAAAAPPPTLAALEDQVMCTVCGVPLSMAREAPAAKRERALIRQLIAEGKSEQQIKDELVATYGRGVLVEPADSGFDLWAWLVPIALTLGGVALLARLLLGWTRKDRGPAAATTAPVLSADDAELVDAALRDEG